MVDETYAEFAPDVDAISAIPLTKEFSCLIVLRGISKFWAAPGLRLGYAVTSDERLRSEILSRKDPWTVSSLADLAGQFLFSDHIYIEETRTLISSERQRIRQALSGLAVKTYPCFANFLLCRSLKKEVSAPVLFEAAIRRGMMIRDCTDFPGLDENFFNSLLDYVKSKNIFDEVLTSIAGCTISTHSGPDAFALIYMTK